MIAMVNFDGLSVVEREKSQGRDVDEKTVRYIRPPSHTGSLMFAWHWHLQSGNTSLLGSPEYAAPIRN